MAKTKRKKTVAEIRQSIQTALSQPSLPLSAVALESKISRRRLRRFVYENGRLSKAELDKVVWYFEPVPKPHEMDGPDLKRFGVNKATYDAVADELVKHGVAFIVDFDPRIDNDNLRSGTLVEIEGRVFIATCAHTIPKTQCKSLAIVGNQFTDPQTTNIEILNYGRVKGALPDVGFLEIDAEQAKTLNRSPIGLNRILISGAGQPGRWAMLYGFPSQLVRHRINRQERQHDIGLASITCQSVTLAADEWPTVPKGYAPANRRRDIFLRYDRADDMIVTHATHDKRLPHLKGVSGGGLWQSVHRGNQVWSNELVKLIGIQSRYYEHGKYARGVQIKHWLKLIKDSFPELSAAIDGVARR